MSTTSGFTTFLDHIGSIFKKVFAIIVPVAQAASPFINILAPGVGTAMNLVLNEVVSTEAAFAAAGNATGTGAQKSAQVLSIIGPAVLQLLAEEGVTANTTNVQNMINAAVAVLNAIPAPTAPSTPAA